MGNFEVCIEVKPATQTWEEAEKIIKEICEADNLGLGCSLRIEVKNVTHLEDYAEGTRRAAKEAATAFERDRKFRASDKDSAITDGI